ncbi:aldo/keto reductase [Psychroserpens sp. NJDZ02]|uniref:aldo/keto reductase n=1 Tax=Psychroserpens sp. NJDZ02 TaxID=2570561 RepID=UPI0010A79115|nr:aldo/keto reductase [Psychroserpens sp. NJDZ02]QCE40913.1 aldo/keto reductase [Psychroserpens sp. NJDZ02]
MKYTTLPNTDIKVSKICLGTMTFGNQNTEAEGHAQLDYAVEQGVNFIDTAELYPVPATAETSGRTSEIIGTWLKHQKRENLVVASKIAGTGDYTAHIRTTGFTAGSIKEAVDLELKRLQTDYIDLYQLHWPERETNTFGVRDYNHNPNDPWTDNFREVLEALDQVKKEGKIRQVGLSNEKAWGTMRYLEESKNNNLPRPVTVQNAYSLLNRVFEGDMAEVSIRENIGLLVYSPMAFGVLSGKYIKGIEGEKARLHLFPRFARYSSMQSTEATRRYLELAEANNMTLAQMSLSFVNQRVFVTSNIIGATTLKQLKENIDSINLTLKGDLIQEIDKIHAVIPNPAP